MLPLQILLQLSEEGYPLILTEVSTLEWESSEPPLKYIWQGAEQIIHWTTHISFITD